MRRSTMLLGTILFLMAAMAVLFIAGGTLSARTSITAASAADYPESFESIRQVLESGAAPQRFTDAALPDAASCRLEDVTITLVNRGLFPAEWLFVQAEAAPGDIAVYSITGEGSSVPARGTAEINLKLISDARGPASRSYHIQYYTYGLKRTITVQLDEPQY